MQIYYPFLIIFDMQTFITLFVLHSSLARTAVRCDNPI